ncbi:DUF1800 family protein [Nevskia sp.]|uniref:DUF1800 family protein n=1 Tax=Nevskia sp. TaxID=1929292 RepID=UPI0025D131BC|nr:DUF1800 family protein [Nevskia sp.]
MSAATFPTSIPSTHTTLLRSLAIFLTLLMTIGNAFAQTVTYLRPTISSFSPAGGAPGTVVTVTGSNFSQTTQVRIGSRSAPFTIVSDTQLTLTVPDGALTGFVRIVNPRFNISSAINFAVTAVAQVSYPQPSLGPHSPTSGPVGTVVSITGSGFTGATAVWLGNDRNLPFTVVSDNEVRATITAQATSGGFGILNPVHGGFTPMQFTITVAPVLVPTISSFSPATGPAGTQVTVSGSNFTGATGVTVGNSSRVAVTSVTATSLSFLVPADATTGSIRVYNSSTNGTSVGNFTVSAPGPILVPSVLSFSPTAGPVGTVVTVNGVGFAGAIQASIGGSTRVPVSNVTATSLSFVVPAGASTSKILIFNSTYNGTSLTNFTVTAVAATPAVSGFSPASGPVGTVVTVTGTGFTGATQASIGNSTRVAVSNVTATSLSFTVPAGASNGPVQIHNPTNSGSSAGSFTVTAPAVPPAVSGFSPTSGPVGTVVTVTGTGFTGATQASIGNSTRVAVSNVTATSLSFTVPADASNGPVQVHNATSSGTSAASFTVTVPAVTPVVSSFAPTSGPVGTVVTVTGTGFTGATQASIGNSTRVAVSNVTATSLSFAVPAGASNGVVQIHNASNSGSSAGSFTVTVPAVVPVIGGFTPATGPAGTVVTVTGSGFTGVNSVTIGGVAASGVNVASATSLSFTVPAAAVTGTVRIANPTSSATSAATFTVTVTAPGATIGPVAAARLLTQGTFGPTLASLDSTAAQTYSAWFAAQASAPVSLLLPSVPNKDTAWVPLWWKQIVTAPDQLRQRMAFALSEIFVVSDQSGAIINQSQTMANYYDLLATHSLGNYRTLLERVTLSPTMGLYLNMFRSNKEDAVTGVHADQNYAREVMQLFSIGLVQLNIDGTVRKDAAGVPIPTYTQNDVKGMADTLTGWASNPVNGGGEGSWTYDIDFIRPMVAYENHHDTRAKTIVGGVTVPAGGTAAQDLKIALDTLFNHPNVGPFISLRLIQRMVTSNPSPAYVGRVASAFNNNGAGVRGDLLAVARAILTDPEAVVAGDNTAGKLREPLIRLAGLWRAFSASDTSNNLAENGVLLTAGETFAQSVLSSPSVFNFFAPDYQRSGQLTFAGLLAPEFQITNENTLVLTANMLQRLIYQYVDSNGVRHAGPNGYSEAGSLTGNSVLLKTAAWEGFAADPALLVDRLNAVFMQGQMPAAMRTTLINYITAIPASARASRVVEATDLLINSPQYAVQR